MPMSVAKVVYSHAGMCPNELNPNLWVDAMSTCMRECESDQVSFGDVMFRITKVRERRRKTMHM